MPLKLKYKSIWKMFHPNLLLIHKKIENFCLKMFVTATNKL